MDEGIKRNRSGCSALLLGTYGNLSQTVNLNLRWINYSNPTLFLRSSLDRLWINQAVNKAGGAMEGERKTTRKNG